jgi:hypothetical protein
VTSLLVVPDDFCGSGHLPGMALTMLGSVEEKSHDGAGFLGPADQPTLEQG